MRLEMTWHTDRNGKLTARWHEGSPAVPREEPGPPFGRTYESDAIGSLPLLALQAAPA